MNGYPVPLFICFLSVSDEHSQRRDSRWNLQALHASKGQNLDTNLPKLFILEKIQVLILILNLFQGWRYQCTFRSSVVVSIKVQKVQNLRFPASL